MFLNNLMKVGAKNIIKASAIMGILFASTNPLSAMNFSNHYSQGGNNTTIMRQYQQNRAQSPQSVQSVSSYNDTKPLIVLPTNFPHKDYKENKEINFHQEEVGAKYKPQMDQLRKQTNDVSGWVNLTFEEIKGALNDELRTLQNNNFNKNSEEINFLERKVEGIEKLNEIHNYYFNLHNKQNSNIDKKTVANYFNLYAKYASGIKDKNKVSKINNLIKSGLSELERATAHKSVFSQLDKISADLKFLSRTKNENERREIVKKAFLYVNDLKAKLNTMGLGQTELNSIEDKIADIELEIDLKIEYVRVGIKGDVKDSLKNFVKTFKNFTFPKRFVETMHNLKLGESVKNCPLSTIERFYGKDVEKSRFEETVLDTLIKNFESDIKNMERSETLETLRGMDFKEQDITRFHDGLVQALYYLKECKSNLDTAAKIKLGIQQPEPKSGFVQKFQKIFHK